MAHIFEKNIRVRGRNEIRDGMRKHLLRGFIHLCILTGVLVCVWYGTRLSMFTIATVSVTGGETISHDEIRALVEREFVGTYFLLIPKRFVFLYPKERILQVLEDNPRIHMIKLGRASFTELNVSFEEYKAHGLWCVYPEIESTCFFIDENGYAFAEAPRIEGGTLVRHMSEGVVSIAEGTVIEKSELDRINTFLQDIETAVDFRIMSLVYKKNGDIEFFINGGGSVLVVRDGDFGETLKNLKAVLTSDEFKHIKPGNFRYIDVRFKNKAFVNEELEEVTPSETASTT